MRDVLFAVAGALLAIGGGALVGVVHGRAVLVVGVVLVVAGVGVAAVATRGLIRGRQSEGVPSVLAAVAPRAPDAHVAELRQMVPPLRQLVARGQRCNIPNGVLRDSFARHFPVTWEHIQTWNDAVDAAEQVSQDFRGRLETAMDEAEISRPLFDRDTLGNLLAVVITGRASLRYAPDAPFDFNWLGWDGQDGIAGEVCAGPNGPCVMRVTDLPNRRDEIWARLLRVNALFWYAHTWPETAAIPDRDRHWLPLRDPLDKELEVIERSHVVPGTCALCGG